jgi:O-antigen ligase
MLRRYSDVLFIALLIFLPLALGSVHAWSITLFSIVAVVLFNSAVFHPDFSLKKLFSFPVVVMSVVFAGYVIFQFVPLPPAILKALSPNTYKFYSDFSLTYPWMNSWRSISVYPWLTISEFIKVIACGLVFLYILFRASQGSGRKITDLEHNTLVYLKLGCLTGILAILLHSLVDFNLHITANALYFTVLLGLAVAIDREEGVDFVFIQKVANAIIYIGFAIALFGIAHKLSGSYKIYWVIEKDGSHFGPYVNYDHYAGFMGMCSSLALASFMAKVRYSSFFRIKGIKDKLMWFSTQEASSALRQFFCAAVMIGSIFYSSSRGGILSFVMAAFVFYFLIVIRTRKSRRGRLLFFFVLIMLLSGIFIFWIGPDETFERFHELNSVVRSVIRESSVLSEIRPQMWADTINVVKDFPVTGTGFGAFQSIFPKYRTHEWGGKSLLYAHCDYLQLVSETGIVGMFFIVAFLVYFVRLFASALRKLR